MRGMLWNEGFCLQLNEDTCRTKAVAENVHNDVFLSEESPLKLETLPGRRDALAREFIQVNI